MNFVHYEMMDEIHDDDINNNVEDGSVGWCWHPW
jgi:hypothetical protein